MQASSQESQYSAKKYGNDKHLRLYNTSTVALLLIVLFLPDLPEELADNLSSDALELVLTLLADTRWDEDIDLLSVRDMSSVRDMFAIAVFGLEGIARSFLLVWLLLMGRISSPK